MEIRIIGCGAMGGAIAQTLAKKAKVTLFDKNPEKAAALAKEIGAKTCKSPLEKLACDHLVLIAVKPQDLAGVAENLTGLTDSHLIVSILAGVNLEALRKHFPKEELLRMMPNLAVKHGKGVTALCESGLSEGRKKNITQLLAPLGTLLWVPESKMDAITALAGSGPAFFFVMVEAMVEAGIVMGLTPQESYVIARQMIAGALGLMDGSTAHPGELRWQVTSPGGTTIAGLRALEAHSVRSGIIETFLAAYERSQELGKART